MCLVLREGFLRVPSDEGPVCVPRLAGKSTSRSLVSPLFFLVSLCVSVRVHLCMCLCIFVWHMHVCVCTCVCLSMGMGVHVGVCGCVCVLTCGPGGPSTPLTGWSSRCRWLGGIPGP